MTKAIRLNFYDNALALYALGIAKQCKGDLGKVDTEQARRIDPDIVNSPQAKFVCAK